MLTCDSDPLGQVVSHIVKSGVICVALSGEVGGPPFQANSPASAVGVLSVGTVENTVKPVFRFVGKYSNEKGESQSFEYEPTSLPLTGTRPLWTWDYKMDFKDPHSVKGCPAFPSGVKDLDKKVVLVPFCLGTMLDAIGKGAKHLLLHDRGENLQSLKPKNDDILSGLGAISRQQGDEWQKSFLKGVKATLSFTDPKKPEYRYREDPNSMGGSVHVLSSWGPTLELDPAPMLMAPGANVLSTLPEKDGSYGVLSRAGGAAPYAAGVAALLKQENKRITPKAVVDLLSTTANPINFHDGKSSDKTLAPPIQQGGGLISAHSALNIKTSVTPTNLKVKGRNHVSMVAIRNNESKWKRYSISHKPSHTVYTVFSELLKRGVLPETATGNAEASFPSEVNVPPKSTIEFAVHFKAPQKLDESRVPVYSGHILIKEKDGDELSIPYLGSPSKLQEIKPFNHGSTYLAASDNYGKQAAKGHVFKFPKDNTTKIDNFVQPVMMVGLDFYAREIQAEVIPESPIKGFDGTLGNHEPFGPFPPGLWIPIPVFGNLASGKKMPEGKFKLNVRGLKHGGEHHEENDWQKVTSSVFGIELVAGDKQ